MKRINIMHLRSNYTKEGGPEAVILSLAKELDSSKFNMIVVSLRGPGVPESCYLQEVRALGVRTECVFWRKHRIFSVARKVSELLKKHRVDILHTHDFRTDAVGWVAARLRGIPIVAGAHIQLRESLAHMRWRLALKFRIHNCFDNLLIRFFDRIVVGSQNMRKELERIRIPAGKLETICYAIDAKEFQQNVDTEKIRDEFNIDPSSPVVGIAGRLSEEKGHRFFLEAAQRVIAELPKTRFLIVGEGPIRKELEYYAKALGVADHVIFTGFYENLPQVLALLDVFVVSSLEETGPLVALEAMAAGKPVVATPVGLIPEAVKHGENGFLVSPKDAIELSGAILDLLRNKDVARSMGVAGRKLVETEFSAQGMAQKLENVYLSLRLRQMQKENSPFPVDISLRNGRRK